MTKLDVESVLKSAPRRDVKSTDEALEEEYCRFLDRAAYRGARVDRVDNPRDDLEFMDRVGDRVLRVYRRIEENKLPSK